MNNEFENHQILDENDYEYMQIAYEEYITRKYRLLQQMRLKNINIVDRLRIESGFDLQDLDSLEEDDE